MHVRRTHGSNTETNLIKPKYIVTAADMPLMEEVIMQEENSVVEDRDPAVEHGMADNSEETISDDEADTSCGDGDSDSYEHIK